VQLRDSWVRQEDLYVDSTTTHGPQLMGCFTLAALLDHHQLPLLLLRLLQLVGEVRVLEKYKLIQYH
jgi:hypothetical protein